MPRWMFWLLALGTPVLLVMLDINGYQETLIIIALVYFPTMILLTIRWLFRETRSIIQLKNEKTKTELLHLQSQVNPHFFFNMLNNLYGLVGRDSPKAQELILKLSDMMRYSIYEGQKSLVTLEEEIEYLQNYIELHKMRYHKKIDINFHSTVQQEGFKVMPLLFIILLENAFKHGVENLIEKAFVNVYLHTDGRRLHFAVENNFDPDSDPKSSGIGLKNLKRRLELVYKNNYNYSVQVKKNVYRAELSLKIL